MFKPRIDKRLISALGGPSVVQQVTVLQKESPHYRFVDLYNAVEEELKDAASVEKVLSTHPHEQLNFLLGATTAHRGVRDIRTPASVPWPVDADEDVYLPSELFWLARYTDGGDADLIVRLRYDDYLETVYLEVAGADVRLVESKIESITSRSVNHSMYRGKLIEIAYESRKTDEYGDVERHDRLRVQLKALHPLEEADFIVEPEILATLRRNVLDLHNRRDVIKRHGIPVRRGVLLYGAPGTGKTYACRYICSRLPGVTKIIVTGTALHHVTSAFSLARMLQPALIILEDVDLIFTSREINLYSSMMGDLLDQMDGLRPFEDISFLLTTNAIGRMEAAIKDRPGRISQLIHFGPPNTALRKRYLMRYLKPYDTSALDLDELVAMSDRATQAFLKEWVHRAAQVATERLDDAVNSLCLSTQDFREAMAEMKRYSEGSASSILGFQ